MTATETAASPPDFFSPSERARLVRLCARLSGSGAAAEDLAQDTLLEAWRARDRLRDPSLRAQWLSGIARNVCRRRYPQSAGPTPSPISSLTLQDIEIHLSDDADLDLELERSEVADLLDQALGLLPAGARDLLVERYTEDLPVAQIAARRDLSEGTAAVRLLRSKRALRRVLRNDLRGQALALGLIAPESDEWQATRIWCPLVRRGTTRSPAVPHSPCIRRPLPWLPASHLGASSRLPRSGHRILAYSPARKSGGRPVLPRCPGEWKRSVRMLRPDVGVRVLHPAQCQRTRSGRPRHSHGVRLRRGFFAARRGPGVDTSRRAAILARAQAHAPGRPARNQLCRSQGDSDRFRECRQCCDGRSDRGRGNLRGAPYWRRWLRNTGMSRLSEERTRTIESKLRAAGASLPCPLCGYRLSRLWLPRAAPDRRP